MTVHDVAQDAQQNEEGEGEGGNEKSWEIIEWSAAKVSPSPCASLTLCRR